TAVIGPLVGYAQLNRSVGGVGRGALKLQYSLAAQAGYYRGIRYGAVVPGSAGFELSLFVRPGGQTDWEIIRVEGTTEDGAVDSDKGYLTLRLLTYATGDALFVFEYEAGGCPSRARVFSGQRSLLCRTGTWSQVTMRVVPSFADGKT